MAERKSSIVRTLKHGVTLVQWDGSDGTLHRGYIPEAKAGKPSKADLEGAAPFGDLTPEGLPKVTYSASAVLDALRRKGIWRRAQLKDRPELVREIYGRLASEAVVRWLNEEPPEGGTQEDANG